MEPQESIIGFDVGNSRVKAAVRDGGGWRVLFAIPTAPFEDLGARLAAALTAAGDALPRGPRRWVASSVSAEVGRALAEDCRRRGVPGPEVFGRDLPIPIPTVVREPGAVGTDRLLCALGARTALGAPCVVVGAGTAITVDLVDTQGRFAGGAIAPGLSLCAKALSEETSLLPLVEPSVPESPCGRDTREAIRSGVYYMCRAGTSELVRLVAEQADLQNPPVAVTGGDASLLLPLAGRRPVHHLPELIFAGMGTALRLSW